MIIFCCVKDWVFVFIKFYFFDVGILFYFYNLYFLVFVDNGVFCFELVCSGRDLMYVNSCLFLLVWNGIKFFELFVYDDKSIV